MGEPVFKRREKCDASLAEGDAFKVTPDAGDFDVCRLAGAQPAVTAAAPSAAAASALLYKIAALM